MSTRNHRVLSPKGRDAVLESILHWKDHRYGLYAACVMPDHAHLLIEPMVEREDDDGAALFFSLSKILHTIKSFTANRVNKIENASGPVWETESFDRMIRSESDLQEKFQYIARNPWDAEVVKPGEDYPWVWWPQMQAEARVSVKAPPDIAAGCRDEQAGSLRSPDPYSFPKQTAVAFPPGARSFAGLTARRGARASGRGRCNVVRRESGWGP